MSEANLNSVGYVPDSSVVDDINIIFNRLCDVIEPDALELLTRTFKSYHTVSEMKLKKIRREIELGHRYTNGKLKPGVYSE